MEDSDVVVAGGVRLRVRRWDGDGPGVALVHGLASNLRLWDGMGAALASLGYGCAAVDLRGHGQSDKVDEGYDVATVAADVRSVIDSLGWSRPVVAGQSWGGNIVLELAARWSASVRGLVCIDGGWISLGDRFPTWSSCAERLAPPPLEGRRLAEVELMVRGMHPTWPAAGVEGVLAGFEVRADGTVAPWLTRPRHMAALRGLWEHRPASVYGDVPVPALLVPADDGMAGLDGKRAEVLAASAGLPVSRTLWMTGDHDLHAQFPSEVAQLVADSIASGFFG